MSHLYIITITNQSDRTFMLGWTGAGSARDAWNRMIERWGKYYEATDRKELIAEIKRKERARCVKVSVPADKVV